MRQRSVHMIAGAYEPLPRRFYERETTAVAVSLLGRLLISDSRDGRTAGVIVETEAYLAEGDPGCHAARGRTRRNQPMFMSPGTVYVYQIYGVHYCLNIVTQPVGVPEAVLVRALEPVEGLELMRQRRGVERVTALCSGPGKLCQALGIGPRHNRGDVTRPPVFVADPPRERRERPIVTATRVGLSAGRGAELHLRYYFGDSEHISRR